ncbi:MAG: hypothetical protein B7Z44_14900, partial [Caulobacter sp. 12-67-6]
MLASRLLKHAAADDRHKEGGQQDQVRNGVVPVASKDRHRSVDENRDLFTRMRAGEFADGTHVLRARIDMQAGNINLRDPVLYRIRHTSHQRTGD